MDMHCAKCGKEVAEDNNYCPYCGSAKTLLPDQEVRIEEPPVVSVEIEKEHGRDSIHIEDNELENGQTRQSDKSPLYQRAVAWAKNTRHLEVMGFALTVIGCLIAFITVGEIPVRSSNQVVFILLLLAGLILAASGIWLLVINSSRKRSGLMVRQSRIQAQVIPPGALRGPVSPPPQSLEANYLMPTTRARGSSGGLLAIPGILLLVIGVILFGCGVFVYAKASTDFQYIHHRGLGQTLMIVGAIIGCTGLGMIIASATMGSSRGRDRRTAMLAQRIAYEEQLQRMYQYKCCPYCSEEILYTAIKCRYCGSDLTGEP